MSEISHTELPVAPAQTISPAVVVQDMPVAMHGMFPVRMGKRIVIAGGGTSAGYSQSNLAYSFTPH